jgi:DNA modification methylase
MSAAIVQANSRHLPLADNSVDLVVTSPPYFALRSYQDGGEHYAGQLGDEPTQAEFVDSLIEVTRECVRVLKPSGSMWVNLGDKYVADSRGSGFDVKRGDAKHAPRGPLGYVTGGMRQKSLMGIPWRYAIRCIDDLGLILRAEVIWSKPNGLPESVTDRVRRSHEQWFHFTLEPRYYSAVDEIREDYAASSTERFAYGFNSAMKGRMAATPGEKREKANQPTGPSPLGKLPGSVWTIPTEPLQVPDHLGIDHFAAFPTEWPRRIIQGWSPEHVCTACGEGRRPVVDRPSPVGNVGLSIRDDEATGAKTFGATSQMRLSGGPRQKWKDAHPDTLTGYACACTPWHTENPSGDRDITVYDWHLWGPAPTTPGVVLDPFGGTGTTTLVATALGRHGISVDMSADYCRLATWRTTDPKQLAKAARRPFVASDKPMDGQGDLLDLIQDPA